MRDDRRRLRAASPWSNSAVTAASRTRISARDLVTATHARGLALNEIGRLMTRHVCAAGPLTSRDVASRALFRYCPPCTIGPMMSRSPFLDCKTACGSEVRVPDTQCAPPGLPFSSLPARAASTTRASSTTPAASRSSSTSRGEPSHDIVRTALGALCNLDHRGASGRRGRTPATAPASWSRCPTASCARVVGFDLPPVGAYGVGLAFLPVEPTVGAQATVAASRRSWLEEGPARARLARRADRSSRRSAPRR